MTEADSLAEYLKVRAARQRHDIHRAMDGGLPPDQYWKAVGRQAQVNDFLAWIEEGITLINTEDDN
jgi:hypothetical protein